MNLIELKRMLFGSSSVRRRDVIYYET